MLAAKVTELLERVENEQKKTATVASELKQKKVVRIDYSIQWTPLKANPRIANYRLKRNVLVCLNFSFSYKKIPRTQLSPVPNKISGPNHQQ